MEPRNRERPDGPPGSVAERNDLARGVERQRPGLPDDLEIRALLDVRKEGFGALDLADHQGVLDADNPSLLGPGQPDAAQRVVHGLEIGVEGEGQLGPVGRTGGEGVDGRLLPVDLLRETPGGEVRVADAGGDPAAVLGEVEGEPAPVEG